VVRIEARIVSGRVLAASVPHDVVLPG